MEQDAIRNDAQLFANAVSALGYSRNVGTGKVVPLPPDADDAVARYKHVKTGRSVCVWPVRDDDDANQVGALADRHGFMLMGYGRLAPKAEEGA